MRVLLVLVLVLGCSGASTTSPISPPPPGGIAPLAWSAEIVVANGDGFYGIASRNGTLHIVYANGPSIYYRRSTDEGTTWSNPTLIGNGIMYLEEPLVIDSVGGTIYLTYFDNPINRTDWCCVRATADVFVRVSRDGGTTWDPATRLTTAQGGYRQSLAVVGNTAHLAWMDFRTGKWDIYYSRSTDSGRTWMTERLVVTGTAGVGAERPQIATIGNVIVIAFLDGRDGRPQCYTYPQCPEVYEKRSLDGGVTWETDRRVTVSPAGIAGSRPDIAAIESTLVLVYDRGGDAVTQQVHVTRSVDKGITWSPPQALSGGAALSGHGTLLVGGALLHVLWMQALGSGTEQKVWHRYSIDRGLTWSNTTQVSVTGDAGAPMGAATSSAVLPLWSNGNDQFVVRRGRNTAGAGPSAMARSARPEKP